MYFFYCAAELPLKAMIHRELSMASSSLSVAFFLLKTATRQTQFAVHRLRDGLPQKYVRPVSARNTAQPAISRPCDHAVHADRNAMDSATDNVITWYHSNGTRRPEHVSSAALFVNGDASCARPAIPKTRSSCAHSCGSFSSHWPAAAMGAPPTFQP